MPRLLFGEHLMVDDDLQKKTQLAEKENDSGLYEALMAHGLHNDNLIWSQFQTLLALQGAAIATGYAFRTSWPSPIIMLGAALLTILLFFFILRTEEDRDVNRIIMDELAKKLIPNDVQEILRNKGLKEPFVRVAGTPPRWRKWIRARYVMRSFILVFFLCDIFLACLYVWSPNLIQ
jgi:hypothetical protein